MGERDVRIGRTLCRVREGELIQDKRGGTGQKLTDKEPSHWVAVLFVNTATNTATVHVNTATGSSIRAYLSS